MNNSNNQKNHPETHIAEKMAVGIILERRISDHPWQDHTWHLANVLPGGEEGDWRVLQQGEGWVQYYAGAREIQLFRRETAGYKVNLSNDPPRVYVVLRPQDDEDEDEEGGHEIEPFIATVCPYEAESYVESGDEQVEGVAMPPEIAAWVQDFVDRHHVEEPFVKRKRKKKTTEDAWGKRGREKGPERGRNG